MAKMTLSITSTTLNNYLIGIFRALNKRQIKLSEINCDDNSLIVVYFYKINKLRKLENIISNKNIKELEKYFNYEKLLLIKEINNNTKINNAKINILIKNFFKADKGLKVEKEVVIDLELNKKKLIIKQNTFDNNLLKQGYFDTLKTLDKLEGDFFYFKTNSLNKNYQKLNSKYRDLITFFLNNSSEELINSLKSNLDFKRCYNTGFVNKKEFNNLIEYLGKTFNINHYHIYNLFLFNLIIKLKVKKAIKTKKNITNLLSSGDLISDDIIITSIYCYLKDNKLTDEVIEKYPYQFLASNYLSLL